MPILVLTEARPHRDFLAMESAGADDFLVMPSDHAEISGRLACLISLPRARRPSLIEVGPLLIDPIARSAACRGVELHLSRQQFDLVLYMATRLGQVVTREMLARDVWHQSDGVRTHAVPTEVHRLRAKLTAAGTGDILRTVLGGGYVLGEAPQWSTTSRSSTRMQGDAPGSTDARGEPIM